MRPVHQSTEIVPLVHAADLYSIPYTDGHSLRQINIVCDKQGLAVTDVDDKALVTRSVVIIRQQSRHNTLDVDPRPRIALVKTLAQATPFWLLVIRPGADGYRVPQKTRQSIPGCRAVFYLGMGFSWQSPAPS